MIRYQILNGVKDVAASGLPPIVQTPEGKAMAAIPGWQGFVDPSYSTASTARNRARRNSHMFAATAGLTIGAFAGSGRPGFIQLNANARRIMANFAMNPDAWTGFFVVETSAAIPRPLMRVEDAAGNELGPNVYIRSGSTFAVTDNVGAGIRVDSGVAVPASVSLLMATFSTRDGLRLFINGVQVAANANDKRPLNSQLDAGQWSFMRGGQGLVGMHGVLAIDLGWPEHAGYRRAIEAFLKAYYAIV